MKPPEQSLALLALLAELSRITENRQLYSSRLAGGKCAAAHERADAACAYLQEPFADSIRLADLAKLTHMSQTAFSRFFRRSMGRTMTQYVMELRIAMARQLLRLTAIDIRHSAPVWLREPVELQPVLPYLGGPEPASIPSCSSAGQAA